MENAIRNAIIKFEQEFMGTLALFTDVDVQIGERVFVFTLDRDIQNGSR